MFLPMKKIAFLTMDSLENFECYDHLLVRPFNQSGWEVEGISWCKENVNWNDYESVIVRSTWDYQNNHKKFLMVLENINNSSATLFNDFKTIKWNMNKTYLQDIQERGINIVPTIWEKNFTVEKLKKYFAVLSTDEIIIKPNISANADNTYLLKEGGIENFAPILSSVFKSINYMVQPFMKNIIREGEYSLFYFDGKYSHTILKTPKEDDFRVQEEHGGRLKLINADLQQQKIAQNIISKLDPIPLYARVDLVRDHKDSFALMELELIEPSLYFQLDQESTQRFVMAFNKMMKKV
jgi:glutathione synthase/RimK-type ligase-like ATP-grasp enzyme